MPRSAPREADSQPPKSFWVRNDLSDSVCILIDPEIEAPVFVDARLPAVLRFVILFGVQGAVPQIAGEKVDLLDEAFWTASGAAASAPTARCER